MFSWVVDHYASINTGPLQRAERGATARTDGQIRVRVSSAGYAAPTCTFSEGDLATKHAVLRSSAQSTRLARPGTGSRWGRARRPQLGQTTRRIYLDRLINTSHQVAMNGPSYRPNKRPGRVASTNKEANE